MTVVKYDVRNVEAGQDYSDPIPVGIYKMRIDKCEHKESKSSGNPMLELELSVVSGDHKGRKVWDYIVLNEASEWKMRQLVDALGLKEKGSFKTEKIVGETIMVKTKTEGSPDDEYGVQSKVASMLKKADDDDEDEDEEEVEESDDDEDEDDDDLSWSDLEGYDRSELKETIKANELEIKVTKKKSDDDLRAEIAKALDIEPDDDEDEDDEDDEEETDYSEMSLAELKAELKKRDLKTSGTKKSLIKRLEESGDSDDDEDDDDGDPF